jgi:hypothetical protein
MVLKAQIGGYDVGRVFMDAGSGINLIYARTLKAMCISLENLKPTDCSFHGIVPGATNYPLGKIELDVCFGNSSNYRREKLEFEVIDWPSQYHAILGRPAFAKFMAVSHYAYLTLKIPGPKGTITVQGSFEVSNTCDKEFNRLAQTFGMTAEYARLKEETDHNVLPDVGRSLPDQAFDATQDSKKIQVHPTDPSKTTSIAENLDPTYESVLIEFLREHWEIFAWCPSDMPSVPRELIEHALNVDPKAKLVKQPLRRFDEPKRKAIASELHRLENTGFI